MTRFHGALFATTAVTVAVLLADGCGPPTPPTKKDGGGDGGGFGCVFNEDCPAGFCKDGVCVTCPETPCEAGYVCTAAGQCKRCTVNCGDAGAGDGGACSSRYDCPAGLICVQNACGQPPATCAGNSDCPVGKACKSTNCVDGCERDSECTTSVDGKKCNTVTNECGCVDAATDCKAGDICFQNKCKTPPSCTTQPDCGRYACINQKCAPCTSSPDCGGSLTCVGGECVQQGCTSDTQCQTITPGHWCNTTTRQCEWGCLAGTAPACGQNCCNPPSTCNTTTHQCGATGTDGGTSTDGGVIIDDGGIGFPDGGMFVACDPTCGCPTGLECFPPLLCLVFGGICVPP